MSTESVVADRTCIGFENGIRYYKTDAENWLRVSNKKRDPKLIEEDTSMIKRLDDLWKTQLTEETQQRNQSKKAERLYSVLS